MEAADERIYVGGGEFTISFDGVLKAGLGCWRKCWEILEICRLTVEYK